jgi:hypothetical protein
MTGRHTRDHLWGRTEVIVLGNKDVEKGGIPGTFWRVPTLNGRWDLVNAAGGPGPVTSGTEFDNGLTI